MVPWRVTESADILEGVRTSLVSIAALACLVTLPVVACSTSSDEPPAFANDPAGIERARENATLAELDIDPATEPVADESDDASADMGAQSPLDELNEAVLPVPPGGLLDNPMADDEEEEAQLTTLAVSPLTTPSETIGAVVKGPWKCRLNGATPPDCQCKGSPLNCQVPNSQPGRNRYLPPTFADEMNKRVAAERAKPGAGKVAPPVDAGKWHVTAETIVYDGAGKVRGRLATPGVLAPPAAGESKPVNTCRGFAGPEGLALVDTPGVCAKINFGAKKRLTPDGGAAGTFVYAFNVLVAASSPSGLDASGWISLAGIEGADQALLTQMPTVANIKIKRDASFAPTPYVIKSAKDWGGDAASFKASSLPTSAYAESKVAPGVDANRKVGDYLLKDGSVWNLAYNTPGIGGIGTDTFFVAHEALGFRRVRSTAKRPTLVRVRVYGNAKKPSIVFAYGSVAGRFGWVSLDAYRKGTVRSTPAPGSGEGDFSPCATKADGTYCSPYGTILGYTCKGGETVDTLWCPSPYTICDGPSPDGKSLMCH